MLHVVEKDTWQPVCNIYDGGFWGKGRDAMEPVALVLESLLGLFLLLSGCLVIRTVMLETRRPRHMHRHRNIFLQMKPEGGTRPFDRGEPLGRAGTWPLGGAEPLGSMSAHLERSADEDRKQGIPAGSEMVSLQDLEDCGLAPYEIAALLRLKRWYLAGEGDRAVLLARWECLRRMKLNGKLDV